MNLSEFFMKCPLCKNSNFRRLFFLKEISRINGKRYPLYKCKNCDLVIAYPNPYKENKSEKIYDDEKNIKFYNSRDKKIELNSEEYKHYYKNFLPHLKIIKKYSKKDEKILDIGCGPGHLLAMLTKKGYKVEGMEISEKLFNALKEKFKVHLAKVDSRKMKNKKYNFLILNHVLEHIENLEGFVKSLNRLLNNKGRVLIAIPYIYGLIPNILRSRWYGLGHGQHLNFFSKKSLKYLFEKEGFRIVEFKILGADYTHPLFPNIINKVIETINNGIVSVGLGDNLFMVAEKVEEIKK